MCYFISVLSVLIHLVERGDGMIFLDYKNDKPLHEQIRLGIKNLIMTGSLSKDEQLPSVRELSISLTVNPNTVQRAYKDLEKEGFVYSVQGRGCFVSQLPERDEARIRELKAQLEAAARELIFLGEDKASIKSIIDSLGKE